MYNKILRLMLLYGSECWALTSKTGSSLQEAEINALRVVEGVTRMNRLWNERIRTDLGSKLLLDVVGEGRPRWYGHDMRKGEGRISILRPCKRWLDGVNEELKRREKVWLRQRKVNYIRIETTGERFSGVH